MEVGIGTLDKKDAAIELRRLKFVGQIAESIFSSDDLLGFFNVLETSLRDIIPCEKILFFQYDDDLQRFYLPVAFNKHLELTDDDHDVELFCGETQLTSLLSVRDPLMRKQGSDYTTFSPEELSIWGYDTVYDLSIPVCDSDGHLLSVLNLARTSKNPFTRLEKSLCKATASFLGKIVERDLLQTEARKQKALSDWWQNGFSQLLDHVLLPTCVVDMKRKTLAHTNSHFKKLVRFGQTTSLMNAEIAGILGRSFSDRLEQALAKSNSATSGIIEHEITLADGTFKKVKFRIVSLGSETHHYFVQFVGTYLQQKQAARSRHIHQTVSRLHQKLSQPDFSEKSKTIIQHAFRAWANILGAEFILISSPVFFSNIKTTSIMHQEKPLDGGLLKKLIEQLSIMPDGPDSVKTVHINDENEMDTNQSYLSIAGQFGVGKIVRMKCANGQAIVNIGFGAGKRTPPEVKRAFFGWLHHLTNVLNAEHQTAKLALENKRLQFLKNTVSVMYLGLNAELGVEKLLNELTLFFPADLFCLTLFDKEKEHEQKHYYFSPKLKTILGEDSLLEPREAITPTITATLQSAVEGYLLTEGRCMGVLEAKALRPNAFSKADQDFLDTLTVDLAQLLKNFRCFQLIKQRVKDLSLVVHGLTIKRSNSDYKESLDKLITGTKNVMNADEVALHPLDGAFFHRIGRTRLGSQIVTDAEISEVVYQQKKIYEIHDLQKWKPKNGLFGAAAIIPVFFEDTVRGMLIVVWNEKRKIVRWDEELMHIMATLCGNVIKTEDLRLQNEVQTNQLIRVNTELENFVYTISHDLKSPIVSIQGFASILIDEYAGQLDDDGRHYLDRVFKNAEHMEQLIRALLELSRIDRLQNNLTMVEAAVPIERALVEYSYQIKTHDVKVNVQENLPLIYCDVIRITQVFSNLIGNAIKFRDSNKFQCTVDIGAEKDGDFYKFFVRDNGVGIAKNHHERIFNLFERHNRYKRIEGTGIGLTISKRIIENHKGKIWIESNENEGATVYFLMPATLEIPV